VRKLYLGVTIILLISSAGASAQFLGQMSPASILKSGTGKIGGYFVTADDALAVVGSLRYGFGDVVEGRFRFGFIDQDGPGTDPHIIVGADGKYLLWRYKGTAGSGGGFNNPIDLSLGFLGEYAVLESIRILGLGGSIIGSWPYTFSNRSTIEPYARLSIRYENVEARHKFPDHVNGDGDDFEVGLNLGALFSVTPVVDLTAEFQLDEQMAFLVGADFAF